MFRALLIGMLALMISSALNSCAEKEEQWIWKSMEVTATAYNSIASQTKPLANVAAWGDTLSPGMKCIAVSRDLLNKGLEYNTPVKIEGFEGIFLVKDKMNRRWENRIDIYMGLDVQKAKEWGRRKVIIQYGIQKEDIK